jgi:hypothetical protein
MIHDGEAAAAKNMHAAMVQASAVDTAAAAVAVDTRLIQVLE